ncbi:MAG: L-threonylcarbamoyladenylate synthase [Oscillospiraceae bacterium]|nr:L-threonylcarbamoyladenylate synthase [Oscillospiraceae bacterium]
MDTKIFIMNEDNIDYEKIKECANAIRLGKLVVFPTETVYGLGANALDKFAVKGIFKAKGRPSDNPLIVHIKNRDDINSLVKEIPEKANELMKKFWPGSLTLILKKSTIIPYETTGNLDTVAIRFPSNKIARSLIEMAGVPIAAPSANISGKVSGTTLSMCIKDLNDKVDYIIGGDDSEVGLESTVVDCTTIPFCILRPGIITLEELKEIDEGIYLDDSIIKYKDEDKPKSPGMKYKHYAPNAMVFIIKGEQAKVFEYIIKQGEKLINKGKKIGIICTDETYDQYNIFKNVVSLGTLYDEREIAKNLFKTLNYFDTLETDIILSESFNENNIGLAIMNRLKKSAGFNIINVR